MRYKFEYGEFPGFKGNWPRLTIIENGRQFHINTEHWKISDYPVVFYSIRRDSK